MRHLNLNLFIECVGIKIAVSFTFIHERFQGSAVDVLISLRRQAQRFLY
jgi:hypothetical protein